MSEFARTDARFRGDLRFRGSIPANSSSESQIPSGLLANADEEAAR